MLLIAYMCVLKESTMTLKSSDKNSIFVCLRAESLVAWRLASQAATACSSAPPLSQRRVRMCSAGILFLKGQSDVLEFWLFD